MGDRELQQTISELQAQQKQLIEELKKNGGSKRKDIWDKLGAIAPVVSACLIAGFGAYFSMQYNQQQIKLQELQTIEKFIPHLAGNEKTKKAAILAMSSLTNAELASKMASLFASEGTVSALQSIAQNGTTRDRTVATQAMAKAFENMADRSLDENRFDDAQNYLRKALAIREKTAGPNSPDLCDTLDRLADLYTAQGKDALAEPLVRRCLSIRQASCGPDSGETISTTRRLAKIVEQRGDRAEAEALYKDIRTATARTAARIDASPTKTAENAHTDDPSEAQATDETTAQEPNPTPQPAHTDLSKGMVAKPEPDGQHVSQ